MSRADQAERAADREAEYYAERFASGEITREEYNRQMQELQRDVRDAYEQDREDALREVDAEWGNW